MFFEGKTFQDSFYLSLKAFQNETPQSSFMSTKDFTYKTKDGQSLAITLYGADRFGQQPCILYLHGFKGFKDWGFVPYSGEYFAKHGLSFMCFNFSYNGIGSDPLTFTEFSKFEKNTFSREVNETIELVELLTRTDFFGDDLNHKLGMIGHSRGGGIALLAGEQLSEVSALCTWASVSTFDRYDKKDKQQWRKKGYKEIKNSRTGQVFRMGREMLDDIERNTKGDLNILAAIKSLEKPLLILHGQEDESVPYYEAETLNIYSNPASSRMRLIPKASHTFGAKHPFENSTPELDLTLEVTKDFFLKQL